MSYYLAVLKKYAVFKGRAQRAEYWYFFLCNVIIAIVLSVLAAVVSEKLTILSFIYVLAAFIPGIAVTVRRLHDTSHNGWWWFIGLVPLIGGIWLIVLMVMDSTPGENQYGPNPKGVTTPVA